MKDKIEIKQQQTNQPNNHKKQQKKQQQQKNKEDKAICAYPPLSLPRFFAYIKKIKIKKETKSENKAICAYPPPPLPRFFAYIKKRKKKRKSEHKAIGAYPPPPLPCFYAQLKKEKRKEKIYSTLNLTDGNRKLSNVVIIAAVFFSKLSICLLPRPRTCIKLTTVLSLRRLHAGRLTRSIGSD